MLKKNISEKVLTIGPDYKNHRGGIGAVINVYQTFFEVFNFIPTYKYYNSNFLKSLFFLRQLLVTIKELLKNKKIEIVHIHGSDRGSFYRKFVFFLITKKIFNKKLVYHIHSGTYNSFYFGSSIIRKKMIRYIISNVDALICLSPYWKDFFSENFKRKKEPLVIHNAICRPDFISSQDIIDQSTCLNLLFLGEIGPRKGIFDLVDLIEKKKDFFSGKIKLFVGGNGETDKLQTKILRSGLGDLITYVGWVDKENKKNLFLKSHIYILPSYNEGLPISVLEAMSYALPVITTPVGGIPEVVKNNKNGILVQPGNHDELDSALRFFLNHPTKITEYGIESLSGIVSYFPDYVSQQLEDLYTSL